MNSCTRFLLMLACCAAAQAVSAQPLSKPDGRWRAIVGAGLSYATGNSNAATLTVKADAVRATDIDKWTLYGEGLRSRTEGETSGNRLRLGGRYDWNLSERWFSFGSLDVERDTIAQLDSHAALSAGLGYKVVADADTGFNVFAGLGYTDDRFAAPRDVGGTLRERYGRPTALLGEESTHKFTASTSANQRLVVTPDLDRHGVYRLQWDAGLTVAMTKSVGLTVGLSARHDSDPGEGLKKTDTLLTTGISVNFD